MTGQHREAKLFRKLIRGYNNALSMASVTANWVARGPGSSNFNPTMTVQGRVYHWIGALVPPQHLQPSFLSVYIHDTDFSNQAGIRRGANPRLNEGLLTRLAATLSQHNPYVQTFESLREWATGDEAPTQYKMVIHADKRPAAEHVRRYNGPEASEVAAIIPGTGEQSKRDIVLRRRAGEVGSNGQESTLQQMQVTYRSCDPLRYA